MFETVAQKRYRKLQEPDPASFASQERPPPKVKYGRRRNNPLPLQGTHFLRKDTYSIPTDDDSDGEDEFVPIGVGQPPSKKVVEPDPDDSPLSEDELEAAYPSNASPILSPCSSPVLPTSSSKSSLDPITGTSSVKKGIAKPVPKAAPRSVLPSEQITASKKKPCAETKAPPRKTADPAGTEQPTRAKTRTKAKGQTAAKALKANTVTRLPVNELLLVPVLPDDPFSPTSRENDPDQEIHDPISNETSSGQKRALSPEGDLGDDDTRAPLTTIRKRLKTPKFTHKSIAALRKKQRRKSSIFQNNDEKANLGDGFESSELKVDHRHIFAKRQRKTLKPLLLGFSALQLQPGPLPDVKFESSSSGLQMEVAPGSEGFCLAQDDHNDDGADREKAFSRDRKRRVSFNDRVLSDIVRQELSSIGAPRKPISVSSDQSESEFEEFDPSDDEEVSADDARDDGEEPDAESEVPAPTPPINQRVQSRKMFIRRSSPPPQPSRAATPSFTTGDRIGRPPRTLASRPEVMEVDDAILDDPSDALSTTRTLLRNESLIEVDDMILDDVDSKPAPEIDEQRPIWDREHDMLDEMEGSVYARAYRPSPPPQQTRPMRPRSILRNPSSRFEARDTRPEDTAANTRRNSTRTIVEAESRHFPPRRRTTVIDAEDDDRSRYFSTASNLLQHPTSPSSQPQIIKMRSNYFARQASHRGEVQVYDSEAQVLETSPEPPDYTNASTQLQILRRGADATWTSSESLPRERKDLRTLTRSVSREYGTLTQSVRRRPSLPFQSPTKIR